MIMVLQSRLNSVMFYALGPSPLAALFNMIIRSVLFDPGSRKKINRFIPYSRTPLNDISAWIVQISEVHPFTYFMSDSQ